MDFQEQKSFEKKGGVFIKIKVVKVLGDFNPMLNWA